MYIVLCWINISVLNNGIKGTHAIWKFLFSLFSLHANFQSDVFR